MKTWWHYYPMLLLVAAIPFGLGALPTVVFKGTTFGGGPIRQWGVNMIANFLPDHAQTAMIEYFMKSTPFGEYSVYLPFAINVALILTWFMFAIGQLIISLNNWAKAQQFKSQRRAAKQ